MPKRSKRDVERIYIENLEPIEVVFEERVLPICRKTTGIVVLVSDSSETESIKVKIIRNENRTINNRAKDYSMDKT